MPSINSWKNYLNNVYVVYISNCYREEKSYYFFYFYDAGDRFVSNDG